MVKYEKYLNYVLILLLILTLFRTCGVSSEVKRLKKDIEQVSAQIKKVDSTTITKMEMVRLLKETPNWKTLEIEELSDKNKIPINFYKNTDK